MPQSANLNEWGIPDWRDAANYGDYSAWSLRRWRWEFFRRNHELRAYFDNNAQKSYDYYSNLYLSESGKRQGFEEHSLLRPDEPGFHVQVNVQIAKKFGYVGIPNPRISNQPSHAIMCELDPNISYYVGKGKASGPNEKPFVISCPDGKMALVFDLDLPLATQLARAKKVVEYEQIERKGKKLQTKRHPAKWLMYLRVIDARADNASWSEIAKILPSALSQTDQNSRDV